MMMRTLDINSDMGEGFGRWSMGDDLAMLDLVSSANVACGFHAGDPSIMRRTVREAVQRGVAVGAHPGFNDLQGFGRRRVTGLSAEELEALVVYQVSALMGIAALEGASIAHVKVHGALSNMASEDREIANAVAGAVRVFHPRLAFVVMPNTELERAGEEMGLRLVREVFADRAYLDDLTLAPRDRKGAVLRNMREVRAHVRRIATTGTIKTTSGALVRVPVDTICVHSDTPGAVKIAKVVREELKSAGVDMSPVAAKPAA